MSFKEILLGMGGGSLHSFLMEFVQLSGKLTERFSIHSYNIQSQDYSVLCRFPTRLIGI